MKKLNEIEEWKLRLASKDAEIGRYRNLENELRNYEAKIANLVAETERLNTLMKTRVSEIE